MICKAGEIGKKSVPTLSKESCPSHGWFRTCLVTQACAAFTLMTHDSYDPSLCQRIWDFRNLLICQMIQCALKTCGAGKLGLFAVNFGTFILEMNRKVMESLAFPLARSRLNGTSWHNYLRLTLPLYSGRINTLPRDDWHCCGG